MKYVGLNSQISRNNRMSILLLFAFPALILLGLYAIMFFAFQYDYQLAWDAFIRNVPITLLVVGIWFVIAYFMNTKLIQMATHSQPLDRTNNMRIYNLTENLCMSVGMKMPALYIIESPALNAYASGINDKTFAVTLTRGLIDSLTDEELEGVIAHELMHIRNKDVRLLIVTIVFVGIFGVIVDVAFRSFLYGGNNRRKNDKDNGAAMIIILLVALVLYFLSMIFKFALSRKREYMADAGAVEMTKNSVAMANALRKVSGNSKVETTNNEVKEMFFDNAPDDSVGFLGGISNIFSTHPPITKRIEFLENL